MSTTPFASKEVRIRSLNLSHWKRFSMSPRKPWCLIFKQLVKEASGCASYIVGSKEGGVCAVIDPLMDSERFFFELQATRLKPIYVLETHTHADHISGAREFARLSQARLYLSEKSRAKFSFTPLEDNGTLELGETTIRAIHTPGHTPDHMSLLVGRRLLSGDSLLVGDVGRADLGGDPELLFESLYSKLLKLEDEVEVYPAHVGGHHYLGANGSSTIGHEKKTNPALQCKTREDFLRYMSEGWPPKPEHYQTIVAVNLGKRSLLRAQQDVMMRTGGRMAAKAQG